MALPMIVNKFAARSPAATEPLNIQFFLPVATRFINCSQSLLSSGIEASSVKRQSAAQ